MVKDRAIGYRDPLLLVGSCCGLRGGLDGLQCS